MPSSLIEMPSIAVAAALVAVACGSSSNDSDGSAPDSSGGGAGLHWYKTCGDPVCRPGDAGTPSGVSPCTTQKEGAACASAAAMCDPGEGCGVLLRCTDRDPRAQTGGCPISRRGYKTNVRYLGGSDLAALEEQLRALRLAHYRYRDAPSRERLGFMIDDSPGSPAVDEPRDMIDLYAYISMVVGTVQRHAARLHQQEREIARLRRALRRLEARNREPGSAR